MLEAGAYREKSCECVAAAVRNRYDCGGKSHRGLELAGELRITGGRLGRRRIQVPPAADQGKVRPTSDRVREALFSSLQNDVVDARVVDAFAGSGALGIEALSRGAASVLFIEKQARVARTLEQNIQVLGLEPHAEIQIGDVSRRLAACEDSVFDLFFADPPYAWKLDENFTGQVLRTLKIGGLLVLERDKRSEDTLPGGLSLQRERVYGGTRISTWQRSVV